MNISVPRSPSRKRKAPAGCSSTNCWPAAPFFAGGEGAGGGAAPATPVDLKTGLVIARSRGSLDDELGACRVEAAVGAERQRQVGSAVTAGQAEGDGTGQAE